MDIADTVVGRNYRPLGFLFQQNDKERKDVMNGEW